MGVYSVALLRHQSPFGKYKDNNKSFKPNGRRPWAKGRKPMGGEFAKLWRGDWSRYHSQSEADAALLFHLAYWTGKDAARMDRLFQQSGLMRPKFNRPQSGSTWGALEVQKAINKTTETYQGPRRDRGNGNGRPAPVGIAEAPKQTPAPPRTCGR